MRSEGNVARVTEIVAESPDSFEDAIMTGFKRASKTLRGITGLRVKEQYAQVEEGAILKFRVTLDVIFILEG
ncbi:MAG: dodecin family protein [Syntrophorhabdus sp.]